MSNSGFPIISGQPGMKLESMKITGASVSSSTQSSAGLDLRGKFFATCQSDGANQVTVKFLRTYGDTPIVIPIPLTANVGVDLSSISASGFTYTTVKRDDHTTGVNNADMAFYVITYNTDAAFN